MFFLRVFLPFYQRAGAHNGFGVMFAVCPVRTQCRVSSDQPIGWRGVAGTDEFQPPFLRASCQSYGKDSRHSLSASTRAFRLFSPPTSLAHRLTLRIVATASLRLECRSVAT